MPDPTVADNGKDPIYLFDLNLTETAQIQSANVEMKWWGNAGRIYFGVESTTELTDTWNVPPDVTRGLDAAIDYPLSFTFSTENGGILPSKLFCRMRYFDPAGVSTKSRDFDGDGIDDIKEYTYLTGVLDALGSAPAGQGEIPSDWTTYYFYEYSLGYRDRSATGDPDRDGFTNQQEYNLGTDPLSPIVYGPQRFTVYSVTLEQNGALSVTYEGDSLGSAQATFSNPNNNGLLKQDNLVSIKFYPLIAPSSGYTPLPSDCQAEYDAIVTDSGENALKYNPPSESLVAFDALRSYDGAAYCRRTEIVAGVPVEVRIAVCPDICQADCVEYGGQIYSPASQSVVDGNLVIEMTGDGGGYLWATYDNQSSSARRDLLLLRIYPAVPQEWVANSGDASYLQAEYQRVTTDEGTPALKFVSYDTIDNVKGQDVLRAVLGIPYSRSILHISGTTVDLWQPADLAITSLPPTEAIKESPSPQGTPFPCIIRDFVYASFKEPDFGWYVAESTPEVGAVSNDLGSDGLPVFSTSELNPSLLNFGTFSNWASFSGWYRSHDALTLNATNSGIIQDTNNYSYAYGFGDPSRNYIPLRYRLNPNYPSYGAYAFTAEFIVELNYDLSSTRLFVAADDDCWVFVNGKLAVDLGGVHGRRDVSALLVDIASNLTEPIGTCELRIFYAERLADDACLAVRSNSVMRPVYVYQVVAESISDAKAKFSLESSPPGMTIDPISGKIIWDYFNAGPGDYPVTVRVADESGGADTQSFTITVE